MKIFGGKTGDEKWSSSGFNAARTSTSLLHHITTVDTYLYEKQPEAELGQSDVALAPINHLPDDVLYYILTLHCRERTDAIRLPYNRSNVAPQVTISHVCSTWRHVMLNLPSFWNDFEVFMDYAEDGDMLLEIVHDWLSRARSLPCSLALNFKADDSTLVVLRQERWYGSIVKRLIAPFRFRKLSMPWSSNHWIQFLQLPTEQLSFIEDLHVCCINPPSLSNFGVLPSQFSLNNFKKLTKLTSLRLDQSLRRAFSDIVYSEHSMFMHVPWHQLRHIQLSIPTSVSFCFTILQGSSMVLETCSFVVSDCYCPWLDIHSYVEPLHCPQLRTLELVAHIPDRSYSPSILDPILLWTRMPNLKALTLRSGDSISQGLLYFSTLAVMQEISNMQLKEITLYNHRNIMDVGELLTNFPSLKRVIVLGHACLVDDTINQLGSGLVAPCLEDLIIQCDGIDLGKLLQMVKVRSSIGKRDVWQENEPTPFRYVKLYRREEVPEEYRESIEEINRRGVQLTVEPWR